MYLASEFQLVYENKKKYENVQVLVKQNINKKNSKLNMI